MSMMERNIRIMGDRLRMHDTKFDCLAAVEPEVVNYPQWLPVERFRLPDVTPVRDIVVPSFTFPENLVAPGEIGRPLFRDADTEADDVVRERGSPPEYYADQTQVDGDWTEGVPSTGVPELEEFGPQGWGPEWDAWDARRRERQEAESFVGSLEDFASAQEAEWQARGEVEEEPVASGSGSSQE
jgi:hypothetical protein